MTSVESKRCQVEEHEKTFAVQELVIRTPTDRHKKKLGQNLHMDFAFMGDEESEKLFAKMEENEKNDEDVIGGASMQQKERLLFFFFFWKLGASTL